MMKFVEEYTHLGMVYFLKCKSKAFSCFKHYVSYFERQTGDKLRIIRTDNGGEYTSGEWGRYCADLGIEHVMGPPPTLQLNWVAERFNQTLLDGILPSLLKSNLPIKSWEDCARHSLASINLSPTQANKNRVAPDTLWSINPSSYKHLRAFGCKVFRLITGPAWGGKLSSKSNLSIHLYTLPEGDGWMVWDINLKLPVKTHNTVFHEDCFPGFGPVSQQTADHWVTWSDKTLTPGLQHSVFNRKFLYGWRPLVSIHSPRNPVNLQANQISLPDESSDEESLLWEDSQTPAPPQDPEPPQSDEEAEVVSEPEAERADCPTSAKDLEVEEEPPPTPPPPPLRW